MSNEWGRGTISIIDACIDYGIPAPTFNYDSSSVTLEIRQGEKVMSEKMSEKILDLIRSNSKVTTNELAEKLEVSTKSIERALKVLKEENQIERVGGRKEGHWKVTEK